MNLAVISRDKDPFSLTSYREHVIRELQPLGVMLTRIGENDPIPSNCDLVWDPGISGNRPPSQHLTSFERPIVLTIHGAAPYAVKWYEYFADPFEAIRVRRINRTALSAWAKFQKKISAVIAVSRYCADEVANVYHLPRERITSIYHGVDHTVFYPEKELVSTPYLLHVSAYQPKKNVDRLFISYAGLPERARPRLIAVVPGYCLLSKNQGTLPSGLNVIDRTLSATELSRLYRSALAFVFPSLHETFGLPILEAMASGCPVVTSYDTACAEVANDAALLVNPRSTQEITKAMSALINAPWLREELRQKGLNRARQFSWEDCARKHLEVFQHVCNGRPIGVGR